VGKIIKGYITSLGRTEGRQIEYDELVGLCNEGRLYGKIQENYSILYSNPEEKEAIDLFRRTYTERLSSSLERSEKESRKVQFINLYNQGVDLFNHRQFSRALGKINQALNITGWEDENNLISQAKYKKWQSLLELALNERGEYGGYNFNEACKIAGNESQIQTLIDSAYKNGHPDRAPIELYYCIFYFLHWTFADEQQKSSIKNNFMTHYHLAKTQNTSGWSAEIADRCNGFFEKMN
jgi:hypothetical protein